MGERWLADGFRVIPVASGFAQRTVDMTRATEALTAPTWGAAQLTSGRPAHGRPGPVRSPLSAGTA
jgi:hypothetical protein